MKARGFDVEKENLKLNNNMSDNALTEGAKEQIETESEPVAEEIIEVYDKRDDDTYKKPGFLIQAKYRSNITSQKIRDLSIMKLQNFQYITPRTDRENLIVLFDKNELARELGEDPSSKAFYRKLKNAAKELTNLQMGIEDPKNGYFRYFQMIPDAEYKNGEFKIEINHAMREYLDEMPPGWTLLDKRDMMSWESVYTYRLYELLKQKAFYSTHYSGKKMGIFKVAYNQYELRLLLGVVNSQLYEVSNILDSTNPPDYKRACEASPEKIHERWDSFKRIINLAIKEINAYENSKIEIIGFSTTKYSDRTVKDVEFEIKLKEIHDKYVAQKENEENKKDDNKEDAEEKRRKLASELTTEAVVFMMTTYSYAVSLGLDIEQTAFSLFCQDSNSDIELVKKCLKKLSEQKGHIKDPVAWVRAAIKANGYDSVDSASDKQANNKQAKNSTNSTSSTIPQLNEFSIIFPGTSDGIPYDILEIGLASGATEEEKKRLNECNDDLLKLRNGEMSVKEYAEKWNKGVYNDNNE